MGDEAPLWAQVRYLEWATGEPGEAHLFNSVMGIERENAALRAQLSERDREIDRLAAQSTEQARELTQRQCVIQSQSNLLAEKDDALLIRLAKAMEQHPMGNGYDRNDWLDEFRAALNGDSHAEG